MLSNYIHPPEVTQNVLRDSDGELFVIIPEATTNVITNPSFERDTSGYNATNATIARSTERQRFGSASAKITPTSLTNRVSLTVSVTPQQVYTASCWIYGVAGRRYSLTIYDVSGTSVRAEQQIIATGRWQWVWVTYQPQSGESTVILALRSLTATQAYYTDGWQLEAKAYATTFCDGTQPGCRWTGIAHASQSSRIPTEPSGGRMRSLKTVFYLSLIAITGLSSLAFRHVTVPLAQGGALYYESQLDTTNFHVIGTVSADTVGQRDARLSLLRSALSPFTRATGTPVWLTWQPHQEGEPSGDQIAIPAYWEPDATESGIGAAAVDLSFQLYLPMLLGYDQASILGSSGSLQNPVYLAWRNTNGAWSKITPYVIDTSYGGASYASAETFAVIDAPQGGVYIASRHQFGTSGTSSTLVHFDGITYSLIGGKAILSGGGPPRTIVTDAQGNLYAGGEFGTQLHASSPNIARFDRLTNTWQPVSSGANGAVHSIIIGPNGLVYVGGQFTSIGGVAVNGIAVYDPQANSFSKLANTGLSSGTAQTLAFDPTANILYVGGAFASVSGIANTQNIAMYNTQTKTWQSMGNVSGGLGLGVTVLRFVNGYLYLGGDVTTANGITINGFGRWNGSQWRAEGNLASDDTAVHAITLDDDGFMLVGGRLTTSDRVFYASPVLRWNGSRWLAAEYGYNTMVRSISRTNLGLFVGAWVVDPNTASSVLVSTSTIITNTGTIDAKPIITITNPSTSEPRPLWWICNRTRNQHLFINYTLAPNETLTLDSQTATIRSSLVGIVYPLIGGDLASFALRPGINIIAVQGYGLDLTLQWKESFVSLQDSSWERGR